MSSTPPRTTDRRQARELAQDALLDVAERLAGVDGAHSLSLKRLADEAGVSTMVIYSRFGDRFGLEEALAKRAIESFLDMVAQAPETVDGVGTAIWGWAHTHRSRFSLLFLTGHLLDSSLRPEIDQSIRRAAKAIEHQVGWAKGRGVGAGLTALAAIVGYLTLELREQVPKAGAEAGYASLLQALTTLDR